MVRRFVGKISGIGKTMYKKNDRSEHFNIYRNADIIFEIEHILNSRPLTMLFDDDEEQVLTPNHLLYGRQLTYTNEDKDYITTKSINVLITSI